MATTAAKVGLTGGVILASAIAFAVLDAPARARHVALPWTDSSRPEACRWVTGWAEPSELDTFGLQRGQGDGGSYVHVRACSEVTGLIEIADTEEPTPFDGSYPRAELWMPGVGSPFPCACKALDAGSCSHPARDDPLTVEPVPVGMTVPPGWSGPGCFPKACIQLAGHSSWPSECGPE